MDKFISWNWSARRLRTSSSARPSGAISTRPVVAGFLWCVTTAIRLNQRIASHKVFASLAGRGKTSTGWFFGFKLHLVINDRGELLDVLLTPSNIDDRKPVPKLVCKLFGKLFGDKGYISKELYELVLHTFGVQLLTRLRSNSRNRTPMTLNDRILLRKRAIVESVIDQLKNISQIEHSRHRSVGNFLVNLLCGLIAYAHQPKKPSLGREALACLPAYPELTLFSKNNHY
jgi:hypothetical protein